MDCGVSVTVFNGRETDLKCRQTIPITRYYRPPMRLHTVSHRSRRYPTFRQNFALTASTCEKRRIGETLAVASCCLVLFGPAARLVAACRLRLALGFVFTPKKKKRNISAKRSVEWRSGSVSAFSRCRSRETPAIYHLLCPASARWFAACCLDLGWLF